MAPSKTPELASAPFDYPSFISCLNTPPATLHIIEECLSSHIQAERTSMLVDLPLIHRLDGYPPPSNSQERLSPPSLTTAIWSQWPHSQIQKNECQVT